MIRQAARRLIALLIPWPARHQRAEAIEAARAQKEVSRAGAAHAAVIEGDIRRMAAQNGFAELLAAQIMSGRRPRGEGET